MHKLQKPKDAKSQVLDGAHGYTQFGRGIGKGNPTICLQCKKPIRKNDAWLLITSPRDPEYGAYSVIVHAHCNGAKG